MPKATRKHVRNLSSSPITFSSRERSSSPCPPPKRPRAMATSTFVPTHIDKENIPLPDCSTPPVTPKTMHSKARALLRASSVTMIVGREKEKREIAHFLNSFADGEVTGPPCLFISGGPGSGKTALLQSLLREKAYCYPTLKTLFFNCMGVSDLQLPSLLGFVMKEISGSRVVSPSRDFAFFMKKEKKKCILVLDEVDQLCSDALLFSNLVELSYTHSEYLRIIGIANTHTLTVKAAPGEPESQTLHFPPYTATELNSILVARLSSLSVEHPSFVSSSTLLLVSRKIASMSGDVRSLLSTLSRAVETSANSRHATVTPAHVLQAIQKDKSNVCSSSAHIQAVRELGLQGRLVLCTLLLALRRTMAGLPIANCTTPGKTKVAGSNQTMLTHVSLYSYYNTLLRSSPIASLSRVDFSDILSMLEVNGLILISLSQTRGERGRSLVSLVGGLREDELLRGMFGDNAKRQDEVKEIWDIEASRIAKLAVQTAGIHRDVFSEASRN